MAAAELATVRRRRLREVWRSAGWPCRDPIELDLLATGLLQRERDDQGRETMRVTDEGIRVLAATRRRNRAALGAHEALVQRVSREMQRADCVVWRGLSLRAPLVAEDGSTQRVVAMPEVSSIRNTTVKEYVEPVIHENKVSRADLLADLRRTAKGQANQAPACQCWYVVERGLVRPDLQEWPPQFGLMVADDRGLELLLPAPRRPQRVAFDTWMALIRAASEPGEEGSPQAALGA